MSTPAKDERPPHAAAPQPRRAAKAAGGAGLTASSSGPARRLAAAVLEVLAGQRTPGQAALALGLSLPRYYQVEGRALRGLVEACEPRPKGRAASAAEQQLAALRRERERLQRELARQQALLRLAQRAVGLPAPVAAATKEGRRPRRRRPRVRALQVAARLQAEGDAAAPAAVASAAEGAARP
jgi:hypothetical protein